MAETFGPEYLQYCRSTHLVARHEQTAARLGIGKELAPPYGPVAGQAHLRTEARPVAVRCAGRVTVFGEVARGLQHRQRVERDARRHLRAAADLHEMAEQSETG